jgi:hypothetical protein
MARMERLITQEASIGKISKYVYGETCAYYDEVDEVTKSW